MHSDFIHTAAGEPLYFETTDNFEDLRQRFFGVIQRCRSTMQWPAQRELTWVIVRDMWLTGFDSPSMHTLYVDKPMKGHNLMQAIARVNRIFKDKPAGLVVDTIGIATDLKEALSFYSDKDRELTGVDMEQAVAALEEALEVVKAMFHGFNYREALDCQPVDRLRILAAAVEHVYSMEGEEE